MNCKPEWPMSRVGDVTTIHGVGPPTESSRGGLGAAPGSWEPWACGWCDPHPLGVGPTRGPLTWAAGEVEQAGAFCTAHVYSNGVGVPVGVGKGTALCLCWAAWPHVCVCTCVCAHRLCTHQEHRLSRPPLWTWGRGTVAVLCSWSWDRKDPPGPCSQIDSATSVLYIYIHSLIYIHTCMYLFMCTYIFFIFTFIITFIFLYSLHLDPERSFESYSAFFNL